MKGGGEGRENNKVGVAWESDLRKGYLERPFGTKGEV
jgi:hypothetical protein